FPTAAHRDYPSPPSTVLREDASERLSGLAPRPARHRDFRIRRARRMAAMDVELIRGAVTAEYEILPHLRRLSSPTVTRVSDSHTSVTHLWGKGSIDHLSVLKYALAGDRARRSLGRPYESTLLPKTLAASCRSRRRAVHNRPRPYGFRSA